MSSNIIYAHPGATVEDCSLVPPIAMSNLPRGSMQINAADTNGDMVVVDSIRDKTSFKGFIQVREDLGGLTFHQAAREGRVDAVKKYLDSDYFRRRKGHGKSSTPPIDRLDSDGVGALHYAARYNHREVMELLLNKGADVNGKGSDDLTPLHFAARYAPRGTALDTAPMYYVPFKPEVEAEECPEGEDEFATKQMTEIIAEEQGSEPISVLVDNGAHVNAIDRYGLSPLHCAADRGNYAAVVELLKSEGRIMVDLPDKSQETSLHLAVRANDVPCVRRLLAAGANHKTVNDNQTSPLHSACTKKNVEIVKLLFKKYEKEGFPTKDFINMKNAEGMTPLHFAVVEAARAVVSFLMEHGADVLVKRKNKDTALHIAATKGCYEIARLLIASVSDKASLLEAQGMDRRTPLHCAARMNWEKTVELLIREGGNIEAMDKEGETPLIVAAGWGQADVVRILLEHGADVFAKDKRERTAIFAAVEENQAKVLEMLLEARGHDNLASEIDKSQNTPLHLAAKMGHYECAKVLLQFGFEANAQNEDDMCPLHLSALYGRLRTAKELVKAFPDIVMDEDEVANTPLHYAAQAGHAKIVDYLTEESAEVDAKNQYGWTPMDCAAAHGQTKCLVALLDAGAMVDPTDRAKTTPLHLAARNGHVDSVLYLLDNGANVRLTDDDGNNALELAIMNSNKDVAECIILHKKWYAALENRHKDGDTPMKKMIRLMPDVALLVFNRCTDDSFNNEHTTSDHWDYQVEFNYRYLEEHPDDAEDESGSDTKSGITDYSIATGEEEEYKRRMRFKRIPHPLQVMVNAKRVELLDHPLVVSLVVYKWRKYGSIFYYANLLIYMTFLIALNIYAFNQVPPYIGGKETVIDCNSTQLSDDTLACKTVDDVDKPIVWWSGLVVFFLSIVRLFIELIQIGIQRTKYLDFNNILELVLFSLSIYFSLNIFEEGQIVNRWQWQIGVVTVFLTWMNLMMFLRKIPIYGVYIVMFTTVLKTFLQIMLILFIFILAFALSFNMVLDDKTAFSKVFPSFMKTFVMMTGEVEYDSYFVDNTPLYPWLTIPLFVIFVIFVPIVFVNLLVGLAVDDIKEVQHRAGLERSVMKISLCFQVENMLPRSWLKRNMKVKVFPNRNGIKIGLRGLLSLEGLPFDGPDIVAALHPAKTGIEELKEDYENVKKGMKKMKYCIQEANAQNRAMMELLRAIAVANDIDVGLSSDNDLDGADMGNAHRLLCMLGEGTGRSRRNSTTFEEAAQQIMAGQRILGRIRSVSHNLTL